MSRTSIFVAALSGAVVALALVAQATDFDGAFVAFALVLLPVVYFLGVVRVARLGQVNLEDSRWMQGMNRIRDAYLEFAPELEPFAEVCPESSVALGAVRSPRSTRRRGTPSRGHSARCLRIQDVLVTSSTASRAGHELDLVEAQMVTALRDERGNHGFLVALCAREQRWLLAAVSVAPLP
jgi:hypothetical protein